MRINTTDPDLQTVFARIKDGSLDLQPEFQRAEVWKGPKKKVLIDTILRGWQVPPVHVILDEENYVQEVLDGQQRLSAIRDFMSDALKVNGNIEPLDDSLQELDGLYYSQLPDRVKNRFNRYAIRVFEIVEYNQGEPGELFNRLNESLKLTSAEKRNAYVGLLRKQMKHLVDSLKLNDVDSKFLGFSNQRLAYHDLFIKLCYLLDQDDLTASYTDKQLNDRARDDLEFPDKIIEAVTSAIETMGLIKKELETINQKVHITKATFFSWLFFISKELNNDGLSRSKIIDAFLKFEIARYKYKSNEPFSAELFNFEHHTIESIFSIFNERASSRVMTASSLIIRNVVIEMFYLFEGGNIDSSERINILVDSINSMGAKSAIEDFADNSVWEKML
ncbi:DUF262 domain-containing protein [Vibrio parahaemolyticus]|nr:DUF262 domain-containing protein [Vibrio parahaemolyticus]EGQ8506771.1 DUF262 domain-containing protein [Vibrio parahaemolyticus]MDG2596346.1 DUF262 domain-containing protein [Vibrio parahaemolyticus]HCE2377834.1 DUF262 domain-containing protein [Vibrio parahaemolyticus]HCE2587271.1 DUF262 domain-containing protein [Vibrio parahaemolyticus]